MIQNASGKHIGAMAPVYATAVVEHIMKKLIANAGTCADEDKKSRRITSRHIMLAARQTPELADVLQDLVFLTTGIVPYVVESQVPHKTVKRRKIKAPKAKVEVNSDDDDSSSDSGKAPAAPKKRKAKSVAAPRAAKAPKKAATAATKKRIAKKVAEK